MGINNTHQDKDGQPLSVVWDGKADVIYVGRDDEEKEVILDRVDLLLGYRIIVFCSIVTWLPLAITLFTVGLVGTIVASIIAGLSVLVALLAVHPYTRRWRGWRQQWLEKLEPQKPRANPVRLGPPLEWID